MSKSDTFETGLLKLIFNAVTIVGIADNTATTPLTSLYVALHTADPGETGTQSTSEAAYTSYARVAVVRTTSGWTVTGNSVSPAVNIDFPACTGGSAVATHFSVGVGASGSNTILYSGLLTQTIAVTNGVTPRLTTATAITED